MPPVFKRPLPKREVKAPSVPSLNAPPEMERPFEVERPAVSTPQAKVEEAVVEVALTTTVSTKLEAASPPVNLIPPPNVEVPVLVKVGKPVKLVAPVTAKVPPTERLPAKIDVAEEEVAMKYPAKAEFPKAELPSTENLA